MRGNHNDFLPGNEARARHIFTMWYGAIFSVVLGLGGMWVFLSIPWNGGLTFGNGVIMGLSALVAALAMRWFFSCVPALIRNDSFGVWVDTEKNELIWWTRFGPEFHKSIPLSRISVIRHELEDGKIMLLDGQGKEIAFDSNCVGHDEFWSDSMIRRFPHIRLERH